MKTFRAAVLRASNQPLEILEMLTPNALGEGQVLIKLKMAALCGSQLGEISAVKGIDKFLPHFLGHEAVAEVLQIGTDVQHLEKGDKVIAHWMKNPIPDGDPISYKSVDGETINSGSIAIFSELAIVSQNRLTKINSNLDSSFLAVIGCGFLTSFGVITRELEIDSQTKGKLLVLGFGGIGQITFSLIKKVSNLEVTILDKNEFNIAKARKMGAKEVFSNINEIRNTNFEFIIDTTGNARVIEMAYELLSRNGVLCLVGVTPDGEKIEIDPMPLHYGRKIIGSFGGQAVPQVDILKILELIESDETWFKNVIGESFSLSDINNAVETLKLGRNAGRILIRFGV